MSPSLQVIGLLGEHPFLARLARALRKQGWATRTLTQVSDVAADAEAAAFVISGDATAARTVAEATDRPLVGVVDSPGAEDLQRLLDAGVDEVIDPAAVKPAFGALLVLKAIQVADRHAREAEAARGVRAEATEEELRDGLTGLYSKEMAERELVSLWQWAVRRRFPVSVVLFDVDHLKKLNETYGDEVGSRVVAAVGRYLKDMSRAADVIAHYGGGRFIAILPMADMGAVQAYAERVLSGLRERELSKELRGIRVSLSAGVSSTIGQEGVGPKGLLRAAEGLLYKAKATGRDRVAVESTGGEPAPAE